MGGERGSAVVESIFGIFVLLVLTVGAIQVALSLYARNVAMAAVHDGARAAIEVGATPESADAIATRVIGRSAGSLIDDLVVDVRVIVTTDRYSVVVAASGALVPVGPVPIDLPFSVEAMATREIDDAAA